MITIITEKAYDGQKITSVPELTTEAVLQDIHWHAHIVAKDSAVLFLKNGRKILGVKGSDLKQASEKDLSDIALFCRAMDAVEWRD